MPVPLQTEHEVTIAKQQRKIVSLQSLSETEIVKLKAANDIEVATREKAVSLLEETKKAHEQVHTHQLRI